MIRKLAAALILLYGWAGASSYLVKISGDIDRPLAAYVESSLVRAGKEGAGGVVFLIDTPGGRVDAAIRISDAILNSPLPTLAVVQNAFSAGALISLSAEQIAMLPGSEIGAAMPISISPIKKPSPVDRKYISAFKGKFRSVAESRGRPVELAEAMVDPEMVVKGLAAKGEPLTLSAAKAVELHVADFEAASIRDALAKAGFDGDVKELPLPVSIKLARVLTSIYVAPLLLALGLLGVFVEIITPGFGVPGALGALFLGLYFAGGLLSGASGLLPIVLFLAGLGLLLAEAFVIPGFGVAGIGGILALGVSIYLTFGDQAMLAGSIAVIVTALGLITALRYLPRTRAASALVLGGAINAQAPPNERLQVLNGAIGTAMTDLRPAGIARFGEKKVDVVSDGDYIPRGSRVRVIEVEGVRVVVRREEEE